MRDSEKLSNLPVITVNYLLIEIRLSSEPYFSHHACAFHTPVGVVEAVMHCLDALLVTMDLIPYLLQVLLTVTLSCQSPVCTAWTEERDALLKVIPFSSD